MQGKKATKNEGIPGVSGVSKGFNFYATRFPGILFAKSQSARKMIFYLVQGQSWQTVFFFLISSGGYKYEPFEGGFEILRFVKFC